MRELTKFMLARPYSTTALATRTVFDLLTKLESLSQASIQTRINIANSFRDVIESSCEVSRIPARIQELNQVSALILGTNTVLDPQTQEQFKLLKSTVSYAIKHLERQLRDHRDNVVTSPREASRLSRHQ